MIHRLVIVSVVLSCILQAEHSKDGGAEVSKSRPEAVTNEKLTVEIEELSEEEIRAKGYDKLNNEERSTLKVKPSPGTFLIASPVITNLISHVTKEVLSSKNTSFKTTVVGHAVPRGVDPFSLTGSKTASKVFRKRFGSIINRDLVVVDYRVTYQYAAKQNGKGHYITNVKVTPLSVETDPFWDVSMSAESESPVNIGTKNDPIASLGFTVTTTIAGTGMGTKTVTDSFVVNGKTGELQEEIRDLE